MLNITAQRGADGAKAYFAKADYYSEGQEIVGEWGGKGAALLGLSGQVGRAAFESLCDNLRPGTAEPLTPMTRDGRRVGYDFTWSASKSVSVVHALTGDERIVEAFRTSIRETMGEMEAEMQARVRMAGSQEDRTTGNLAWAEFVHLTSRPVNGLPTPQLHAHLFCFNSTYDSAEERWKAGQFGRIKQDAFYWQAVQRARFARSLQGLGYAVRRTKDAFEIAGVPDATLKKFSLRTAVIERAAAELGITDAKQKAKLGATTREAKRPEVPYPDLVGRWDGMLVPSERSAVAGARGLPKPAPARDADHVAFARNHLFERTSVVAERRLMAEALKHGLGEVTPEGVRGATKAANLLRREERGTAWVTTPEALAEERAMVGFAAWGKGACRPLSAGPLTFGDPRLNEGQRRAVAHVLASTDRVMLVRGIAGTGKTTLTREAVAQIEKAGRSVVMLAPSAQASRGVLRDEGFAAADTLARFLADPSMQQKARGGVIWLDEASLVGSKTMAQLFGTAGRLDARVVLMGDKGQLGSVERGAPLRVLEDLAGLRAAEVTDIRRQSGEYRDVANLLARGESSAALDKLDALGWVKEIQGEDRYRPLADDYAAALARGESALVVSPTHAEGALVTAAVREQLRAEHVIGTTEQELPQLVPLGWTQAQRADPKQYTGEEILQFHRRVGGFEAGTRVRSADVLPVLTDKLAGGFTAYAPAAIRVAAGETLRVTANGKTKDGRHRLNNGELLRVASFTRSGDLVDGRGWVIPREFGQWAYGYVTTAQAAQGRTVDHVLIAHSAVSTPASSRENFYVAVTRGKKSATVYTDDKAELAAAVARQDQRPSATELMQGRRAWPRGRLDRGAAAMRRMAKVAARRLVWQRDEAQPQRELAHAR